MRQRLDEEVFSKVFDVVLGLVAQHGLLQGKTLGVDSTQLRADASMKAIVRKDTGENYQEYTKRLAAAAGEAEKPTADDARRHDRKRKGKKTSNKEWESETDEDARIARMKNGTTRLAHKAEHVVEVSLLNAVARIEAATGNEKAPQVVTDKGHHNPAVLRRLTSLLGVQTIQQLQVSRTTCSHQVRVASPTTSSPRVGEAERHLLIPELHDISIADGVLHDPLTVEERAVRRIEIGDQHAVGVDENRGVLTRDAG